MRLHNQRNLLRAIEHFREDHPRENNVFARIGVKKKQTKNLFFANFNKKILKRFFFPLSLTISR